MNLKIYTQDKDGKHLLESNADYKLAQAYKAACRNITIEDPDAWKTDILSDAELEALYGVKTGALYSATVFSACLLLSSLLIILAAITQ